MLLYIKITRQQDEISCHTFRKLSVRDIRECLLGHRHDDVIRHQRMPNGGARCGNRCLVRNRWLLRP